MQLDALYGLGRAYLRDDRSGDAATILNQLLQLGGDGVPSATHYHLAQALYALGNSAEALAALDAYLAANPDMAAYVYGDRGDWLAASGDTDGALAAYQQAVSAETAR